MFQPGLADQLLAVVGTPLSKLHSRISDLCPGEGENVRNDAVVLSAGHRS
jgi:hypothetical protein